MPGGAPVQGTTGKHYFNTYGATADQSEWQYLPNHDDNGPETAWYPPMPGAAANGNIQYRVTDSGYSAPKIWLFAGPQNALYMNQLTYCGGAVGSNGVVSLNLSTSGSNTYYHLVLQANTAALEVHYVTSCATATPTAAINGSILTASCSTPGNKMFWKKQGGTAAQYTGSVTLTESGWYDVWATRVGYNDSAVVSVQK
jgi:hypothetical protein